MSDFLNDVWRGLNASPKYLSSKYFYDEAGDALFRELMACPEYYLTRCELEIFSRQSGELSETILGILSEFDLVELGPGDATKSVHLLGSLLKKGTDFTYYPIDISGNVISLLKEKLPATLPSINMHGLNGEYFEMLGELKKMSSRNKVVLFLGSNIGNVPIEENAAFFKRLSSFLVPGDLVLTGFDLRKDPKVILAAYNDKGGITKRFNLNLLSRINTALDADFELAAFEHRPVYNEATGACKSFLESLREQKVRIGEKGLVHFNKGEQIYMEISQKYTAEQIDEIAGATGFASLHHFYDSKKWFLDALWRFK